MKSKIIYGIKKPDKIISYFKEEKFTLLIVGISGIIYNAGLSFGPFFEGKLAQCLYDIIGRRADIYDMISLGFFYVALTLLVQGMRCLKRFYVRRFANNVNRSMKHVLYGDLVHKEKSELSEESVGVMMTKTISDVDACAEGMRKFTTEIFDTGIALVAYIAMLFYYDWRLTLLCLIFPPISYIMAEKLKKTVQSASSAYKISAGKLNGATMDRVSGEVTYRVFGAEEKRDSAYGEILRAHEKSAVHANVLVAAMEPLYRVISLLSVVFIIYLGSKNVLGSGFCSWNIAAFTTFLSCFVKMAVKSSKAAKLFNSVQQAQVSWKRIKPLMKPLEPDKVLAPAKPDVLCVENLSFAYPNGDELLHDVSFSASPGQFIGVTGPVASGKSTLGKVFLLEYPYCGSVSFAGKELSSFSPEERSAIITYQGHEAELISGSIAQNILLGESADIKPFLEAVCMDKEVDAMPEGDNTLIGSGGVRLSGGQQARLALARSLFNKRAVNVMDDPFSALDKTTEEQVFANIKKLFNDDIVLLISHRLYLFPLFDKVIWLEDGRAVCSDHESLMTENAAYAALYLAQTGGSKNEKK